MQISVCSSTYARRITQTHTLSPKRQVEIDLLIVGICVATERNQPASGARREVFNLQPILIKGQRSINLAKPAGQISVRNRTVTDLELALHDRLGRSAGDIYVHGYQTGRGEVGIKALNELEIDAATCA